MYSVPTLSESVVNKVVTDERSGGYFDTFSPTVYLLHLYYKNNNLFFLPKEGDRWEDFLYSLNKNNGDGDL